MATIAVVIPAYNEAHALPEVLEGLKKAAAGFSGVVIPIVVDDGSKDATAQVARAAGVYVYQHLVNRGLGAALSTGITAAHGLIDRRGTFLESAIVTLDADGQHDATELFVVAEPILRGEADVVLGSRFVGVDQKTMPLHRQLANRIANTLTGVLFGVWVSDTQSGYRGFSYQAAKNLAIRTSTMEVSSEIIREIGRNKWRLKEVPVTVAYTAYSLSKGQSFTKGLETLWKLIMLRFFR